MKRHVVLTHSAAERLTSHVCEYRISVDFFSAAPRNPHYIAPRVTTNHLQNDHHRHHLRSSTVATLRSAAPFRHVLSGATTYVILAIRTQNDVKQRKDTKIMSKVRNVDHRSRSKRKSTLSMAFKTERSRRRTICTFFLLR